MFPYFKLLVKQHNFIRVLIKKYNRILMRTVCFDNFLQWSNVICHTFLIQKSKVICETDK